MLSDWCSSDGRKNLRKGMYEKENKSTKICITVLFSVSAVAYLICGAISAERATNAHWINTNFKGDSRLDFVFFGYNDVAIRGTS